jgi:hypothetical protein
MLYNIAFKVATEHNFDYTNEEVLMKRPSMLQLSPTLTIPTPMRFQAILEEKKTSSPDEEWREIPKCQLTVNDREENLTIEKNKKNDPLATSLCFEKKFLELQ